MGLTDVIADSFEIVKRYPSIVLPFLIIFIIGAIAIVLFALSMSGANLMAQLQSSSSTISAIWILIPGLVILVIVFAIVFLLLGGIYIDVAVQGFTKKPSLGEALGVSSDRFWSMLAYGIITGAVYILVFIVLALLLLGPALLTNVNSMLHSTTGSTAASAPMIRQVMHLSLSFRIFALVLAIVYCVLYLFFWLGPAFVVAGKLGPIDALKKSVEVGKKKFWPVLGTLLLLLIISLAFGLITDILAIIPILGVVIVFILYLFFYSFMLLIPTVFYLEYVKKTKPNFRK